MNSQDGITKTIRLSSASVDRLTATYELSGVGSVYVRFGLSPNLYDLMLRGQAGLTTTLPSPQRLNLANTSPPPPSVPSSKSREQEPPSIPSPPILIA